MRSSVFDPIGFEPSMHCPRLRLSGRGVESRAVHPGLKSFLDTDRYSGDTKGQHGPRERKHRDCTLQLSRSGLPTGTGTRHAIGRKRFADGMLASSALGSGSTDETTGLERVGLSYPLAAAIPC